VTHLRIANAVSSKLSSGRTIHFCNTSGSSAFAPVALYRFLT
jgi:hypothetical protein